MELFAIQCTTCNARLKVREESAIGEILSCPKCHSMVQVVPPPGWKKSAPAVAVAAATTAAATKTAPVLSAAVVPMVAVEAAMKPPVAAATEAAHASPVVSPAVAASVAHPPKLPPAIKPAAGATPPPLHKSATSSAAATNGAAKPAAAPITTIPAAATEAAPAAAVSTSARLGLVARLAQDRWLYGGALAAGLVFGVGGWLVLLSQAESTTPTAAVAAVDPAAQQPAPAKPAVSVAVPRRTEDPQPVAVKVPTTPEPIAVAPQPAVAEAAPQQPEPAFAAPAEAPGAPPDVAELLGGKPAALPPALPPIAVPQPIAPDSPANQVAAQPAAAPEASADNSVPAATPILSTDQIEGRLGSQLLSVQFRKVPLGDYVDFLAKFSTLPIALDQAALASRGKGAATPVSVQLEKTTVAAALTAALTEHGLTFVVRDGQIVVTAAAAARAAEL